MTRSMTDNPHWVHAVANRWDTGVNETFCGITNLKKRKYIVLSTAWYGPNVTCPHCLNSAAYKERVAHQMAKRMIEGEPKESYTSPIRGRTSCIGPE